MEIILIIIYIILTLLITRYAYKFGYNKGYLQAQKKFNRIRQTMNLPEIKKIMEIVNNVKTDFNSNTDNDNIGIDRMDNK